MARKIPQHFTLDKDVIERIENQAKEEDRSKSFIVNKILREFYNIIGAKPDKAKK